MENHKMPKFCSSAKAIKTKFRDKNQGINNLISIIKQDKTTHFSVAKHFLNLASFEKGKILRNMKEGNS